MSSHQDAILMLCNRFVDRSKLAQAVIFAQDLVKWAKKYQAGFCIPMAVGQQFNAISSLFGHMSESDIDLMASLNAIHVAKALCKLWEQGSPDLLVEDIKSSPSRILITINDPASRAYQIIQQAKLLGLLEAVGAI